MYWTIDNPSIPYTGALPGPLQHGHIIRIQGSIHPSASCFSINLQCGSSTGGPRPDVALHLSPVFTPPPRIVRNSFQNQTWGPEESHGPSFPLTADQGFEILILAETTEYKIAVNGQHFTEFSHRIPLHSVSHLAIDGDVTINVIKFESTQASHSDSADVSGPIGFIEPIVQRSTAPELGAHRPSSPYGAPPLPYPTGNMTVGPQPSSVPYGVTSPSQPYGPPGSGNPYGPYPGNSPYSPPMGSPYGGSSPNHPYGPSAMTNPYGPPPSGGFPSSGYPSQPGGYPSQSGWYPSQPGGYPSQPGGYPYPSQAGPYPGTTVVYPGQEKDKSGSSGALGGLTALGTALAGGIGGAMLGGKHGKHGHSLNPASALMSGGPASMIGGFLGSGGNKSKSGSSSIPIGGAVAGGAAALAGAYMLSKSPIGKAMKPKKMKKLYKHKHKLKHGFGGFYSSSSSSSSEEE